MSCIAQSVTELKIARLGVMGIPQACGASGAEDRMLGLGILRINVPTTIQGSGKRTPKDGKRVMAEVQARLVRNGAMGTNGAAVGAVIRGGALAAVGSQGGMVGDAAVLGLALLILYAYA